MSPIKLCLTLYETSQSNRLPVFLLQLEPAAKLLTYNQKWSIASISPFQTLWLNPFVLLKQTSQKATSYIVQQHFFCVPLLQCLPAPLSFSCLIVYSCSYVAFTQGGVAKLGIIPLLSSLKCQRGVAKLGNWHWVVDKLELLYKGLNTYTLLETSSENLSEWAIGPYVPVLIWKSFWMGRVSLCQSNILIASCTNTGEQGDMQVVKYLTRNAKNKKNYVECSSNFIKIP